MDPKLSFLLSLLCLCCCRSCLAQQCGSQASGALCPNNLCCSQYGYCGSTDPYCGMGCQSQCGAAATLSSLVTDSAFDAFFPRTSDASCGFYTYKAFLTAAAAFPGFATATDADSNKRELAAFFANAAHDTTGGCSKEAIDQSDSYCSASETWPCAEGKKYFGRGPLQISGNYNYGQAGKEIGFDGLNNPETVATDPVISFKTAVWFWMTSGCHSAITGGQGFGKTVDIISGGKECRAGATAQGIAAQQDRIVLYKKFCRQLGVQPGDMLSC